MKEENPQSYFARFELAVSTADAAFICVDNCDEESLVLDSVSIQHVRGEREWCTDCVDLQQLKAISTGSGEKFYAHGRGDI